MEEKKDSRREHVVIVLNEGSLILSELLSRYGFVFCHKRSGASSGGAFARGEFLRDNRALELHFRYSLGMVIYRMGSASITHDAYMWSVIGRRHASHYPGFSDDPLDAFRRLYDDLAEYGNDFLVGSDDDFLRHVDRSEKLAGIEPRIPS